MYDRVLGDERAGSSNSRPVKRSCYLKKKVKIDLQNRKIKDAKL